MDNKKFYVGMVFQRQEFFHLDFSMVKCLKGYSGGFIIGIDMEHGADYVAVYRFNRDDMTNKTWLDDEQMTLGDAIISVIFGRKNADGIFKGSKATANWLSIYCNRNIIDYVHKDKLQQYQPAGFDNYGYALENYLTAELNYTHGSPKQDRNQKIDVIDCNNHRWQVKCSIATYASKGSYSSTNGSIFDEE